TRYRSKSNIFPPKTVRLALGWFSTSAAAFDVSSMSRKIAIAREAAAAFLKAGNPDDDYFLIEFNSRPVLVADFTSDVNQIEKRIFSTVPGGSTAFYDALHMAVEKLKNGQHSRKAVLLIADGEDNSSRFGFRRGQRDPQRTGRSGLCDRHIRESERAF